MDVQNVASVASFITNDGSEIRELLAHRNSAVRNQSLAEARVPAGTTTAPHYHPKSEEIYFILEGCGLMRLGEETRQLAAGDAVAIPPGVVHQITNSAVSTLRFLCCCAPGYEHDDTILV